MGRYSGLHICMDCGNTDHFRITRLWRIDATTEDVYDCKTEEWVDEEDPMNGIDSQELEDENDITCDLCNSSNIEVDLDKEEILEIRVEHTYDEDGSWSRIKLDEKEQNKKLKSELAVMKI